MNLQLQLEDNFFHNNPSSVRKTTEFVIERVSSNVIKKIRTKIIPEQREAALEKVIISYSCIKILADTERIYGMYIYNFEQGLMYIFKMQYKR